MQAFGRLTHDAHDISSFHARPETSKALWCSTTLHDRLFLSENLLARRVHDSHDTTEVPEGVEWSPVHDLVTPV